MLRLSTESWHYLRLVSERRAQAADGTGLDALSRALPRAASLTIYMCWHGGLGHGYPQAVVDAAGRLRERHMPQVGSNQSYTALTFPASPDDVADFEAVAPFCDLAYLSDDCGEVLAEITGQGHIAATEVGQERWWVPALLGLPMAVLGLRWLRDLRRRDATR